MIARAREIRGSSLAKSVAFSVFASLLPLLVVGVSVVGFIAHGQDDFASKVIERLGLTGSAADLFTDAIAASADARATTSVIGLDAAAHHRARPGGGGEGHLRRGVAGGRPRA